MKTLILPWSKSITNRDLILASLNEGKTVLRGTLFSDDTRFMMNALIDLWIDIEHIWEKTVVNWWISRIKKQTTEIYVGQSGIAVKFLPVLCCLLKEGGITFSGEERLMERPLWPLIDWIKQLWIKVEAREDNFPPLTIYWQKTVEMFGKNISKIKMDWTISSQYFSAFMNIWAYLKWWLEIEVIWDLVSKPYIDMTIFELFKFGIEVENNNYESFKILEKKLGNFVGNENFHSLQNNQITIEWDASALSYIANYIVLHWWRIEITNLWKNTKQGDYKYLEILEKYFWLIWESDWKKTILKCWGLEKTVGNENFHSLQNVEINFENMPDISMSFMSLAIFLPWKTKITGLKTLNLKECKRIDVMKKELEKFWIEIESTQNSITIWEYKWKKAKKSFFSTWKIKIETYKDHRIAMTFWVLESYLEKKFKEKIRILNPDCVTKTYPNFWEDLKKWWEIEDVLK